MCFGESDERSASVYSFNILIHLCNCICMFVIMRALITFVMHVEINYIYLEFMRFPHNIFVSTGIDDYVLRCSSGTGHWRIKGEKNSAAAFYCLLNLQYYYIIEISKHSSSIV